MKITKEEFGRLKDSSMVYLYTLENSQGSKVGIITYGARVQKFLVPDAHGTMQDIVLGYDTATEYEQDTFYLGTIVGRHANRIKGGKFTINGTEYQLEQNDGKNQTNSLHSGHSGFHCHLWQPEEASEGLKLTYYSPDGDGGFPGNFTAQVTYELTEDNALKISYTTTSDADTICNMTNHSYFNLNGNNGSNILDHQMQIFADKLTEADDEALPNGNIYDAKGTPMDFTAPTAIGARIDSDFSQLVYGLGYDHNWILTDDKTDTLHQAAYVEAPQTGITLTVLTDMPGVQFYSGNFLTGVKGKNGIPMPKRGAFCLETQYYPNSLEHPEFPQPILKKNTKWHSTTVYQAGTK